MPHTRCIGKGERKGSGWEWGMWRYSLVTSHPHWGTHCRVTKIFTMSSYLLTSMFWIPHITTLLHPLCYNWSTVILKVAWCSRVSAHLPPPSTPSLPPPSPAVIPSRLPKILLHLMIMCGLLISSLLPYFVIIDLPLLILLCHELTTALVRREREREREYYES